MKTSAYTPFEVGTRDRIVGFFVIGAVLLFLIGFLIPVIQQLSEDEGVPFYTILDRTYGIAPNATVSLHGVEIGTVEEVAITDEGTVRVDVALSTAYRDFYRYRSKLSVDTNIGVNTLLTGSGLILIPGDPENDLLEPGEFIPTRAPQGISSLLDDLDVVKLTDQVTEIVSNVEDITTGVATNQQKIYRSLDNLEEVTASLSEVSRSLPGMVNSVDESLTSLQSSMAGVDRLVANTDKDLQVVMQNTVALTDQATGTLQEAEKLFQSTEPLLDQLPTVLITTDVALQSLTRLSDQLGRSWLLGGSSQSAVSVKPGLNMHPHDDDIYIVDTPATAQSKQ